MSEYPKDFAIFVNSTDSFEDCWDAFFILFKKYWGKCDIPIYLNTEEKDYSYPDLNIICTKVCSNGNIEKRKLWGWCLKEALKKIPENTILYLQEDYFLNDKVDKEQLFELVDIIQNKKWSVQECSQIGVSYVGAHNPYHITEFPLLWEVDRYAKFRVSLQSALWNKNKLASYIRDKDSGWTFEMFGANRTRNDRFLTLNRQIFNPEARIILPYLHTGIIQGKWNEKVVDLFKEHDINIDLSKRGFYDEREANIVKFPTWQGRIVSLKFKYLWKINHLIDKIRYHRL
ncbi:MAG: hypothetical protein SNJ70_10745 [Armatimonadota bacterium]